MEELINSLPELNVGHLTGRSMRVSLMHLSSPSWKAMTSPWARPLLPPSPPTGGEEGEGAGTTLHPPPSLLPSLLTPTDPTAKRKKKKRTHTQIQTHDEDIELITSQCGVHTYTHVHVDTWGY